MNNRDLRVIKTKESIEKAFIELIKIKPISKITVIELAQAAKINKSTFYLHYQDIQDLFNQTLLKTIQRPLEDKRLFANLFFDPERFFMEIGDILASNFSAVFILTHTSEDYRLLRDAVSILIQKTYEAGVIEKNRENDLKLETLFSAMMFVMPQCHDNDRELGQAQMIKVVRALFPGMEK